MFNAEPDTCKALSKYFLLLSLGLVNVHFPPCDENFSTWASSLISLSPLMSAMTENLPQQPGSLEYFNRITKIVFLELSPARVLQLLAWNCQNKPETQAFCQILFGRQGFHMQSFLPAPSPPLPNPILLGSTLYQPCSSGLGKQGFILAPFGRAQLCGEDSRVETH